MRGGRLQEVPNRVIWLGNCSMVFWRTGRWGEVVAYESFDHIELKFSSLQCGNCRDLPLVPMPMQCFIHVKVNFEKKNPVLPLRNFHLLCYSGIWGSYNTLISTFLSIICRVVAYGRLQTRENCKLLALKVVTVAYERWSLTRGSKQSDLTGKLLVF